MLMLKKG